MYNKIDSVSLDFLDSLAREPHTAVMSCELDLGVQDVVERCWQVLQLMRIYTKRSVHYSTADLDRKQQSSNNVLAGKEWSPTSPMP